MVYLISNSRRHGTARTWCRAALGALLLDCSGQIHAESPQVFGTGNALAQVKLRLADPEDAIDFGQAVSMSGEWMIVGAPRATLNSTGAATLYRLDQGLWHEQQQLLADDGASGDFFAAAVAVSGDTAVVGALYDNHGGFESGSAYVFERVNGQWQQMQKLSPADGLDSDQFGHAVGVYGDQILIGAPRHDVLQITNAGAVYVFEREGNAWNQVDKLTASQPGHQFFFGHALSVNGQRALIGTYTDNALGSESGSAYVFERVNGVWGEQVRLLPSDGDDFDQFGLSVALHGDRALIGCWGCDDAAVNGGAAYVFDWDGTAWLQSDKLIVDDVAAHDAVGYSVALHQDRALLGAHLSDLAGEDAGAAYLFELGTTGWTLTAEMTARDASVDANFGRSVALTQDQRVIGAPFADNIDGQPTGAAYVYVSDLIFATGLE